METNTDFASVLAAQNAQTIAIMNAQTEAKQELLNANVINGSINASLDAEKEVMQSFNDSVTEFASDAAKKR